jgi:hypothetical protein
MDDACRRKCRKESALGVLNLAACPLRSALAMLAPAGAFVHLLSWSLLTVTVVVSAQPSGLQWDATHSRGTHAGAVPEAAAERQGLSGNPHNWLAHVVEQPALGSRLLNTTGGSGPCACDMCRPGARDMCMCVVRPHVYALPTAANRATPQPGATLRNRHCHFTMLTAQDMIVGTKNGCVQTPIGLAHMVWDRNHSSMKGDSTNHSSSRQSVPDWTHY